MLLTQQKTQVIIMGIDSFFILLVILNHALNVFKM